jgi:hypothetical protein
MGLNKRETELEREKAIIVVTKIRIQLKYSPMDK